VRTSTRRRSERRCTTRRDRLTKQAFATNAAGDTAEAASLFAQASGFDPRPTTILSHVNMRLKLGECELAAACYERLLAGETLSETAWYIALRRGMPRRCWRRRRKPRQSEPMPPSSSSAGAARVERGSFLVKFFSLKWHT